MKATLFKEVVYSLSKLIEDIDLGEIGLPEIACNKRRRASDIPAFRVVHCR